MRTFRGDDIITILGRGIGLGEYIPGLVIKHQLNNIGLSSEFITYENILDSDTREQLRKMKLLFQKNYNIALMSLKLSSHTNPVFDNNKTLKLIEKWAKEDRKRFVVHSAAWLPVLEKYLLIRKNSEAIKIDLIYLEIINDRTWKIKDAKCGKYSHIHFFNFDRGGINYYINMSQDNIIPFHKRLDRYLLHGGGWNIGNYYKYILILNEKRKYLDVVINGNPTDYNQEFNKFFQINPLWNTWDTDASGQNYFPPFGEFKKDGSIEYIMNSFDLEIYNLARNNKAMICKTGGASLLDSFSAATPILYIEPYGEHEKRNSDLWELLGFGMSLQKWIDSNCDMKILERMHCNIIKHQIKTKNFVKEYALCI